MTGFDMTIAGAWLWDTLAAVLPFECWGRLAGEGAARRSALSGIADRSLIPVWRWEAWEKMFSRGARNSGCGVTGVANSGGGGCRRIMTATGGKPEPG